MRIAISAGLLALLAACQGDPAPSPSPSASPRVTGYIAKVKALDPALLNGVLFRAISDAQQQNCQQVKSAAETTTPEGQPAWVATCQDQSRFTVVLFDDGTARVTPAVARQR